MCLLSSVQNLGASRGFAFVEFNTEAEAINWMEYKQVSLYLAAVFFLELSAKLWHEISVQGGYRFDSDCMNLMTKRPNCYTNVTN